MTNIFRHATFTLSIMRFDHAGNNSDYFICANSPANVRQPNLVSRIGVSYH